MKKRITYFSIVGVIVLILSLSTLVLGGRQKDQKAAEYGKELKKEMDKEQEGKGEKIAKVGNEIIYQSDINKLRISYKAAGQTFSDEELLKKMIKAKLLIEEAKKNKLVVSDEELDDYFDDLREGMEADPIGKETLVTLAEELDMTVDEYFEFSRESSRNVLLTNKLRDMVLLSVEGNSIDATKQKKDIWIEYTDDLYNNTKDVVYY